ncbi:hypothetical protein LSCM4_00801 [Leishmania orientalis]|uniref:Uncharacterized protein n=1 Tax=Leishmania orientalis TaxID=2249476 RepID=A0A836KCV7_9TRYP|nr:hypothetical protein LSCM4_00801 [Leishmania orientalis]
MLAGVYTYAQFSSHLSAVLGRHPRAAELRLQLFPPVSGPQPPLECCDVQGGKAAVSTPPTVSDSSADFVTLYAVLLPRRDDDDSDGEAVAVYPVVGHVSHISLNWCAQLQRSLSITALLAAPTRSFVWYDGGFCEDEVSRLLHRECVTGVSSFEVQLFPYVPPLQWRRAVDGVFSSHHLLCSSYTCLIGNLGEDDEGAGIAHTRELRGERDDLSRSLKAAAAAVTSVAPPMQRPRREGALAAVRVGAPAAGEAPSCSSSVIHRHFPLRLAAVLNGNVPLGDTSGSMTGTRVLCLVALDGTLLTGSTPPDPPSLSWQQGLFDTVSDFVSREVMPRVSLQLIDGKWARAEGSERLLDDVCRVRQVLGTSYVVQYAPSAAAPVATRARSIVLVLDLSVPLQHLLSPVSSMCPSSRSREEDRQAPQLQRCLAAQVAEAVQNTIGQLVSQHPDVFAFTLEETAATEKTPAVQVSRGPMHFTRDMHCRSIAASVAQIFALSSHTAFAEEVVRLLWGSEAGDEGIEVAATTEHSREKLRVLQRQPAQIRQRIEERLMSAIPP